MTLEEKRGTVEHRAAAVPRRGGSGLIAFQFLSWDLAITGPRSEMEMVMTNSLRNGAVATLSVLTLLAASLLVFASSPPQGAV